MIFMIRTFLLISIAILALISLRARAAPPPQLYGKSVVLTYTNVTSMRAAGTQNPFKTKSTPRRIVVYISTGGKIFMRAGRSDKHNRDRVGDSGGALSEGATAARVSGRTMEFDFGFEGGASHAQATFDANFDGCTATVLHGKEAGRSSYLYKNYGKPIEIESSVATNVSCSVSTENVFAN
jgi:hypothetical protein